ncbi:MAG: hypothetical protein KJ922_03760, partial [Nanoarchaeota archaeon]|nr:hypothetical protein [Nanoarchaeota archaeon]
MVKRTKAKPKNTHYLIIAVSAVVIALLIYTSITTDRLQVQEYDGYFVGTPLISQGETLIYNNEFCANKLTGLAHEVHFIENDLQTQ